MSTPAQVLFVQVPFAIRKRGGHKLERADRAVRSAFPVRAADDRAEVAAMEVRLLVGDHVGLHVADEGGVWLVLDAVLEGLKDVFLEAGDRGNTATTASRTSSSYWS